MTNASTTNARKTNARMNATRIDSIVSFTLLGVSADEPFPDFFFAGRVPSALAA